MNLLLPDYYVLTSLKRWFPENGDRNNTGVDERRRRQEYPKLTSMYVPSTRGLTRAVPYDKSSPCTRR